MADKNEIIRILKKIDEFLPEDSRFTIFIIGGAAACLLDSKIASYDIDVLSTIPQELDEAVNKAKMFLKTNIEFGYASVSDMPYNTADRLSVYDCGLRKITILIPDPLDLILMKLPRGLSKDVDDALELIKKHSIPVDDLVSRFLSETSHYIGSRTSFTLIVSQVIDSAYGESESKAFLKIASE